MTFDYLKYIIRSSHKFSGKIFAVATAVIAFIPFDEILIHLGHNTFTFKILFLLLLYLFTLLVTWIDDKKKKQVLIASREKTKIYIQYDNMKRYICDNDNTPYTVVVPINTNINVVGDSTVIKPKSIHGFWLEHMKNKGYDANTLKEEVKKRMIIQGSDCICKIGDFAYIKDIENVNYMLIASCVLDEDDKSHCTIDQYFDGIQALIRALSKECDLQEKIYIPVIGGGYAFMEKTNQELLQIMIELFIFNISKFQHEIHIIVYEDLREQIHLLQYKT